jgi:formylglycine-generating enzyme required for sulfatase activity
MPGCAATDLVAVGTRPAGDGRWGQSELVGNVNEWTLDWDAAYVSPCMDCASLSTASKRVMRGASMFDDATALRASRRSSFDPAVPFSTSGVRCARAP